MNSKKGFLMFNISAKRKNRKLRGEIDNAISFYLICLLENPDISDEEISQRSFGEKISTKYIWEVAGLFPLVAGRVVLNDLGICFSDEYVYYDRNGRKESSGKLHVHPVYLMIQERLSEVFSNAELFQAIALRGAELNAINQALHAGSDPKNLVTSPIGLTMK